MSPTPKPKPAGPRPVVAIHRGPPRYYPHLGRLVDDGEKVEGVTAALVAEADYLEPEPDPGKDT